MEYLPPEKNLYWNIYINVNAMNLISTGNLGLIMPGSVPMRHSPRLIVLL